MGRVGVFLESIKFSHSVFALPFALVAMLVAAGGLPGWWTLGWIVVACVAARTAAMAFNRLVDRDVDARNPRTAGRALVTGALSTDFMTLALVASSLLFVFAARMLNSTCFVWSLPTLGVLFFYSVTKRFTPFSHIVLGVALGLAPIGAWVAVTETLALAPVLLSAAVVLWVAGFDVLYACQDVEFDNVEAELFSLPKRLGVAGAMTLARRMHMGATALFIAFWWWGGLGAWPLLAIGAIGGLLVWQHRLVSPHDLSRIDAAFFTANGVIALAFLVAVFADLVVLG